MLGLFKYSPFLRRWHSKVKMAARDLRARTIINTTFQPLSHPTAT